MQLMVKMNKIVKLLWNHKDAGNFRYPVEFKALGLIDYPIIIQKPMDLNQIKRNIKRKKYTRIEEFRDDVQLIWDNCKNYNQEESEIYKQAIRMEKYFSKVLKKYLTCSPKTRDPRKVTKYPLEEQNQEEDLCSLYNDMVKLSQKFKNVSVQDLVKAIAIILQEQGTEPITVTADDKFQIKLSLLSKETIMKLSNFFNSLSMANSQFDDYF